MARIRSIKPEFFTSRTVAELPLTARMTFIGLWVYCDNYGRGVDDARLVKAAVWPLDDRHTSARVEADLAVLAEAKLIERYAAADGRTYLAVRNWLEHQLISHPGTPKIPPPPSPTAELPTDTGTTPERHANVPHDSGNIPETLPKASGKPPETFQKPPETFRASRARAEQGAGSREQGAGNGRAPAAPETAIPETATRPPPTPAGVPNAQYQRFWHALPPPYRNDFVRRLRSAHDPPAVLGELEAVTTGLHPPSYSHAVVGRALHEIAVAGGRFTANALRGFCRRIAENETDAETCEMTDEFGSMRRWRRQSEDWVLEPELSA